MERKNKITVVDYDSKWAEQFAELRDLLLRYVNENDIISIEHVGSTSIVGLKAKPIIDLDIIVTDGERMAKIIAQLAQLGYEHIGDLGVVGREAFKRPPENILTDGTGRKWFEHHLYVCQTGSIGLRNHLALRDYLRQHPEKIIEYGNLKQDLAEKYPYDIDAYIDGKTGFITSILSEMGLNKQDISTIQDNNKIP